jgi:(1->4)-alpha-D-glucan 1-alpha-D-glucosylmutase
MSPADDLSRKACERAAELRRLPEATYRLQFHAGFTFQDARRIVPYLRDLGVTHCYASPYLRARPGSTHGYDIIDHGSLNPEIGSTEDYNALVGALKEHGLGQILDTVPNHMGIATNDNGWWNDILESGPASRCAGYFDIAWRASPRPELQDKVLLPVLGEPYGDVLEKGQLRLVFEGGAFTIAYYDRRFPLAPRSYGEVLGHRLEELERSMEPESLPLLEYQSILTALRNLPDRMEISPGRIAERQREKEIIKRRLIALTTENRTVREFVERNVARFNGKEGVPHSFDLLDKLLDEQCYRLAYWRVAADEINYRRFFDINDLAALSMERDDVFEAAHALIFRLLAAGDIGGLRIDHPDGLYDPEQYFRRLQEHFLLACARSVFDTDVEFQAMDWRELEGPLRQRIAANMRGGTAGRPCPNTNLDGWPLYVVAEKILGSGEPLSDTWAVYGTSGYDFVNQINGLFVDAAATDSFRRLYQDWIQDGTRFNEIVYQKKLLILQMSLASELYMLAYQLDRLAQKSRKSRDFTLDTLRHALREVIACFPVYRSYITDEGVHEADRRYVEMAVRRARIRNPLVSGAVFRFLRSMLLLESPESFTAEDRAEQRRFAGKFQQVTAPVTAKGIEDTAFYVFNRLVSLNEVGGDPGRFGVKPDALHAFNRDRQARWPYSLSPLSTHDTKRSEDARARINVLSEMPEDWRAALERWGRLNEPHRQQINDLTVPDANEEYLLYQTLVGAWPLGPVSAEEHADLVKRIQAYMEKAVHEAKVHTSWINPDADFDNAIQEFVRRFLDENTSGPFLQDFRAFQSRVSHYGLFNSLAQTLLKIASPGVPDTYQGTELWDFSLVDPDNRRHVDYERRRKMLGDLQANSDADRREMLRGLVSAKEDGRIKLYITYRAQHCRRDHPGLFSAGEYLALEGAGAKADHLFAFARQAGDRVAVVVVPRLLVSLTPDGTQPPLGGAVWQDTTLLLPRVDPALRWHNIFTGERLVPIEQQEQLSLAVGDVLAHCPIALLMGVR